MNERKEYISWDEYFMGLATYSAQRSKDPKTQVGACIVNSKKRIVAIGYNGMPTGCGDEVMPWSGAGKNLNTKYFYVCHAELNAILNSNGSSLEDTVLYTTLFPCNECTKAIIQVGICRVVFLDDYDIDREDNIASKRMLKTANITVVKYKKTGKRIVMSL